MDLQPSQPQPNKHPESVTLESVEELGVLANNFVEEARLLETEIASHELAQNIIGILPIPDGLWERVHDRIEAHREKKLIKRDPRYEFMKQIIRLHDLYEYGAKQDTEFEPITFTGDEAELAIQGILGTIRYNGVQNAKRHVALAEQLYAYDDVAYDRPQQDGPASTSAE